MSRAGQPRLGLRRSSPNLFIGRGANGQLQTLVGDGQKSGIYWAFDPG